MNLRPYNSAEWQLDCRQMSVWPFLFSKYGDFVWSYRDMTLLRAMMHDTVYERGRLFLKNYNICDMVPWYYINKLNIKPTDNVLDIGCGINPFKEFIPNLIGMDNNAELNPDLLDQFDSEFVSQHNNTYDAIISINAIHFAPLTSFAERIDMCRQMLKPNGRAFISTNIETWLMYEDYNRIKLLFNGTPDLDAIIDYIYNEIIKLDLKLEVLDLPIMFTGTDSSIRNDLNGNIRLVFEK